MAGAEVFSIFLKTAEALHSLFSIEVAVDGLMQQLHQIPSTLHSDTPYYLIRSSPEKNGLDSGVIPARARTTPLPAANAGLNSPRLQTQ
ncbi:MAG: hypothetical protein HYR90_03015 [Candidatus Andersenbacteria bacterium]|nr:hypothetical protein [Candidatus Andersenbacteria bacterium]